MKKFSKRRGSALLLAVIFVILAAGLGGAFFAFSAWKSKSHFLMNQGDDAQQICDAGLEMARAALLQWRNLDHNNVVPPATTNPYGAGSYAWNKVFLYCKNNDVPLGMGLTADADVIRADAMLKLSGQQPWKIQFDNSVSATYDATGVAIPIATCGSPDNSTIGQGISDLFCVNRKYGKGAFHIVLKNDVNDVHGDGVDNGMVPSGNVWNADLPWQKLGTNGLPIPGPGNSYAGDPAGTVAYQPPLSGIPKYGTLQDSDIIDGNGIAILIVTATLPDGTVRQVEATISYPFAGVGMGGAIRDNGDITLNGAFTIGGTLGSVFANGNISGNGSAQASVSQDVSAAGSASGLKMNNAPPGGINSGVAPQTIDAVNIPDYLDPTLHPDVNQHIFILGNNGTITYAGTAAQPAGDLSGFSFKGGSWSMSGKGATPPPNAVYYIQGDFSMTGQGNAPAYNMTLIATGSVTLGGNSKFVAATKTDGSSLGTLVLAGQDVALRGTGQAGGIQYDGSVFANEQVDIRGNFTLNGSITGANAGDTPGSAVSSQSVIAQDLTMGGNPTVIYNGGPSIVAPSADHIDVKFLKRTR